MMAPNGVEKERGRGERGGDGDRQVFNKVISLSVSLGSLLLYLFALIGGKLWKAGGGSGGDGGNPHPFCLSNCCGWGSRVFVITVKSKPPKAAGLRAERLRDEETGRILNT